jgi:predicted RND superfamily exporter protein
MEQLIEYGVSLMAGILVCLGVASAVLIALFVGHAVRSAVRWIRGADFSHGRNGRSGSC